MQRDFNIIREILMYIEEIENAEAGAILSSKDFCTKIKFYDEESVIYNLDILKQSNLVKHYYGEIDIYYLTWQGHDLIGYIRDDIVWTNIQALLYRQCMGQSVYAIIKASKILFSKEITSVT